MCIKITCIFLQDDLVLPEVCTNSSTCKSGSNISGNGSESGSGSGSDSGSGGMSGQMIQGIFSQSMLSMYIDAVNVVVIDNNYNVEYIKR